MEYVRKHPAPIVALFGALLAGQSILWEYARVAPDYRFIVTPWSVRGYDLIQGGVILTIAACIATLAILAWYDVVTGGRRLPQLVVGAAFVGVAAAIAAVAGSEYEVTLSQSTGIAVSIVAGFIASTLIKYALADRLKGANRQALAYGGPIGLSVVFYVALVSPLLVDDTVSYPLWALTAILATPFVLLAILGEPRELATNRLLILAVLTGWGYVAMSGATARAVLVGLQRTAGAASQYKDVQITSGMILAFAGMGLAFLGSVAMWAQRRDQLIARKRAAQQRRAAEESAAELAEALELLDPQYR